jgi:hypothetical protein
MLERIIDARWLEPPEPMELTLAAIEILEPNEKIRLLIHREPYMLFQILEEWGYGYQTLSCDDRTYEILIWFKESIAPSGNQASS